MTTLTIEKALLVPRDEASKSKVRKTDMDRAVFSVMYDPALPFIPRIIAKGYRAMVESDPRLKEVLKSLRWSPTGGPRASGRNSSEQGAPAPGPKCSPKT